MRRLGAVGLGALPRLRLAAQALHRQPFGPLRLAAHETPHSRRTKSHEKVQKVQEVQTWQGGASRPAVCAYWDNGRLARCEERMALTDFAYSTTLTPPMGSDPMAFSALRP